MHLLNISSGLLSVFPATGFQYHQGTRRQCESIERAVIPDGAGPTSTSLIRFRDHHHPFPSTSQAMSAYGVFKQPHATGRIALSATAWPLKSQVPTAASTSNSTSHITIFHLTSETATAQRGLVDYLRSVFSDVVDEGLTYPLEDKVTPESFEAYFLAGDLLVGIHDPSATISGDFGAIAGREATTVVHQSLESAKGTKDWRDAIVGFYYVSSIILT